MSSVSNPRSQELSIVHKLNFNQKPNVSKEEEKDLNNYSGIFWSLSSDFFYQ